MAKEDFCFTYYDGDAARDKAHMNRLERGAYDDIISAQRKRGHLSMDDIRKVLSGDFSACWPALEWILLTDENGKFYIEWVDRSIEKMQANSKRNKDRIEKYWADKRQNDSIDIPRINHGLDPELPLGSGNGDENGDGDELKGGAGETNPIPVVVEMKTIWLELKPDYPQVKNSTDDEQALFAIGDFIAQQFKIPWLPRMADDRALVITRWRALANWILADDFYRSWALITLSSTKSMKTIWQKSNDNGTIAKNNFGKIRGRKPDPAPGTDKFAAFNTRGANGG